MVSEKELYRKARKEDALMYIAALLVIIGGFALFPLFSLGSALPAMTIVIWAGGVVRFNMKNREYLLFIMPEVERLVRTGVTEHQAMQQFDCDNFYYKPFWAIR